MNRKIRLIALSNDAFALAAANFSLPIYSWEAVSQNTESISSLMQNKTWQLRVRNIQELIGLNPTGVYTTLGERLSGLPKGYSWKVKQAICLYEEEENLQLLEFQRDTIHPSFSTENTYQKYIAERMKRVWNLCCQYYVGFKDMEIAYFRPSTLVLEKIDGSDEKASDIDTLIRIRSKFWSDNNPISKEMFDLVWRIESQRGVYEYAPYLS